MTQETETVSQRAREACIEIFGATDWSREQYLTGKNDRKPKVQAVARFERELSTNKDETIATLREALKALVDAADSAAEVTNTSMMDFAIAEACDALTSTEKEG